MAPIRDRLQEYSVGAIVGAIVPALISLGIFATKADTAALKTDVAELKAEIYREFMPRRETEMRLDKIEKGVDKLLEAIYRREKR